MYNYNMLFIENINTFYFIYENYLYFLLLLY